MDSLIQDVRFALRALAHSKGFTAAALLTLALGIGGTCALFGVIDSVFLRPLPFADEGRLLRLQDFTAAPGGELATVNTSGRHFVEMGAQLHLLSGVSAQRGRPVALTGVEDPERLTAALVSPRSFAVLGLQPQLGRSFSPDEEQRGEDAGVVLISAALWHRRFGGERGVLGRSLGLDGREAVIIGVLPDGVRFPYRADLWLPTIVRGAPGESFAVFARLAPGATLEQARAELASLASRMPQLDPRTDRGYGILATPLRQSLIADQDRVAPALFIVLGFFLLLACANVALLLLARSVARRKEFAVRSALGAGRRRQVRQLLTESATLGVLGGGLGLLSAVQLRGVLAVLVPRTLAVELGMAEGPQRGPVFAFALCLSLLAALLCGLWPALQASKVDLHSLLKEDDGGGGEGPRRLLGGFVVGQIALGLVLLCGAGLLIENLRNLQGASPGFEIHDLLTAELPLPPTRFREGAARAALALRLQERLSAIPGVSAAAIESVNPLQGWTWTVPFVAESSAQAGAAAPSVNHRLATPGLFAAMGIPLLRGRDLGPADIAGAPLVAVVSARLAARTWPGQDPLGRRVRIAREGAEWLTVVGVAGDVKDQGDVQLAWYLPYAQHAGSSPAEILHPMVRSKLDPAALARSVRAKVAALDPLLALDGLATMDEVRAEALSQERLSATTVGAFALIGLVLAAVGTFGVMAWSVSRRTRELGLRMALGAAPRDCSDWSWAARSGFPRLESRLDSPARWACIGGWGPSSARGWQSRSRCSTWRWLPCSSAPRCSPP